MSEHLGSETLQDLLDGTAAPGAAREAERHLAGCAECGERLATLRQVIHSLRALPREADPDRDLWPGIAAAIGAAALPYPAAPPRAAARHLLPIAAALLLFLGGAAAGRWTAPAPATSAPAAPATTVIVTREPAGSALDVQRAGTEYVAALARLAERDAEGADARQAREAAVAALEGAARELAVLTPDDARIVLLQAVARELRESGPPVRSISF